jgi:5-formyltetrahydrofolate cyclo-ligase
MESKKELRKKILTIRNKMEKEEVENNSKLIMDKIMGLKAYKE